MEACLAESQRLAAIGETTAMVGHDLRNPLQAMVGITYLTKKKYEESSKPVKKIVDEIGVKEMIGTVEREIHYMDKIVSDLHDYAAPLRPKLLWTDVAQLIRNTLPSIRIPTSVRVTIVARKDIPKTKIDSVMMRRVFTNLIVNAIQAMPKGGKLAIRISRTGRDLTVGFRDTGIGMPKKDLSKLFEPFFTTKPIGQGLGLPVCKRLVEAHDGRITVHSRLGQGSTFTVRIPLKEQ
jgi:signal transduction histidine kinase